MLQIYNKKVEKISENYFNYSCKRLKYWKRLQNT